MKNSRLVALFSGDPVVASEIFFYLDENIDQRIVEVLVNKGIKVITVEQEELKGEKDDDMLLARATKLGAVFVTQDNDIHEINAVINELWLEHGTKHAGIIFQSQPYPPGELAARLEKKYNDYIPEQMINLLLTV